MTSPGTTGVLVMSYGTPAGPEDVEAYYTDVRRGRPPSPDQLADLERRYQAIGGVSPLAERTAEQVAAITAALDELEPGRFVVRSGTKHGRPRLEEGVRQLAGAGVEEIVGLVLAPHYSAMSVGDYVARAEAEAAANGLRARFVLSWHDDPELVGLLAERVDEALDELPAGRATTVVFTAHSLPERILESADPYPEQLALTASLVARQARLDERGVAWRTGWQSAGRTAERWLGPDVLDLLRQLAREGSGAVVVCAAGFTADHLEVLYDLDIEARRLAEELGIAFARTASLNAEPRLARLLARRVLAETRPAP